MGGTAGAYGVAWVYVLIWARIMVFRPITPESDISDRFCRELRYHQDVPVRFSFPNPVDEVSARLVAAGVVAQGGTFLVLRSPFLLVTLAYGFAARVAFGPRFSPLGRVVTQILRPRIPFKARFVAGPPKRFAQGMGLAFSSTALVSFAVGAHTFSVAVIAMLLVAALLESVLAVCLGCIVFRWLMKVGIIPVSVCESCADISGQLARLGSARL